MSAALQQNPQFQLKLSAVKGPHAGQVFHVNKDKVTIGRGPENDVVLMNDPQVSRLHAQLVLIDRDIEVVKISQKNSVLVGGESIERWKLVNGTTFVIGDTELKIEFDLGKAVASIVQPKSADVIPLKNLEATNVIPNPNAFVPAAKPTPAKAPPPATIKNSVPTPSTAGQPRPMSIANQQLMQQQQMIMQQQAFMVQKAAAQQSRSLPKPASTSLFENPKARFYMVLVLIIAGAAFFFMKYNKKSSRAAKPKAVLKYEDEIAIKLNSTPETELVKKREEKKKDRFSPQYARAQENLMRGMRDFGLGNYARAQEFFQVVLNLDPDNPLAKRHLMLARIRFDELVQSKLMLGESYYNKHNFDMCLSMYQQVMNMLDDKRSDAKYRLAERKAKECELAVEGIR